MDAIASVITGNVFLPDTDVPDLSGKVKFCAKRESGFL